MPLLSPGLFSSPYKLFWSFIYISDALYISSAMLHVHSELLRRWVVFTDMCRQELLTEEREHAHSARSIARAWPQPRPGPFQGLLLGISAAIQRKWEDRQRDSSNEFPGNKSPLESSAPNLPLLPSEWIHSAVNPSARRWLVTYVVGGRCSFCCFRLAE